MTCCCVNDFFFQLFHTYLMQKYPLTWMNTTGERRQPLVEGARVLTAGLAAAALFASSPTTADAGVILTQPEVKNFVTGKEPAKKATNDTKKEKKAAVPSAAMTSSGFDFKPLVLPISLVTIGAGGFALVTLDEGFAELMVEGGAKDSRNYAGYETSLKDTPFFGGNGSIPSSIAGSKTTSSKSKSKTTKGGLFS